MAIRANAIFRFDHYMVSDAGIELYFFCPDPGPGEESFHRILIADAELATVVNQMQLRNLVMDKLSRWIRKTNIASKLDPFLGQQVVL